MYRRLSCLTAEGKISAKDKIGIRERIVAGEFKQVQALLESPKAELDEFLAHPSEKAIGISSIFVSKQVASFFNLQK